MLHVSLSTDQQEAVFTMTDTVHHVTAKPRIIVCGGRNYDRAEVVNHILDEYVGPLIDPASHEWPCIVHGAASGADSLADDWAIGRDVLVEPHPADWAVHGRAAGPIRNQEMLEAGADLVIAFPGGRGTGDMIRRARRAGVRVAIVAQGEAPDADQG